MQSVQKENRAVNSGLEVEGEERVVAWIVSHIRCFWTLCTYIYIYFYLSYFKNTKDEYKLKLFVEKKLMAIHTLYVQLNSVLFV